VPFQRRLVQQILHRFSGRLVLKERNQRPAVQHLAAMSEFPFALAIFHHGFHHARPFERTAQAFDVGAGDGFQEDAFGRGDDGGPWVPSSISNSLRSRRE